MEIMELPVEIAPELKKYATYRSEQELLEELKKHPTELLSFFLYACEDETWCESYPTLMIGLFNWLTDANINRNFPNDFFQQVIIPIQKHMNVLKPFIPLDLIIKIDQTDYPVNSLLLSNQSYYFKRRIKNECRRVANPELKINDLPLNVLQLIDEFILTGEIKDLWKIQPDELWAIIDDVVPLGVFPIVEVCEIVLRRYIDRNNVFDMLIKAHQKTLQLLQNACIEFINQLDMGVRLQITPVEDFSMEFLDYKERAFEVFDKLSGEITHLVFSSEMANDSHFRLVINQTPKLMGLDLSDSTKLSDYLNDIPHTVKELHLSYCKWISNAAMQTLSIACPQLSKLDLSSNDQLTYAIWSELQRFKKLAILDISRCFQVGDNELKIILRGSPKLVELRLIDCQKITHEGFFEIGKLLPNLSILNISRTSISDAALIDIMTRCKNLYSLDISRCESTSDKGVLEGIRSCPSLKTINISASGLTKNGIKSIYPYLTILQ